MRRLGPAATIVALGRRPMEGQAPRRRARAQSTDGCGYGSSESCECQAIASSSKVPALASWSMERHDARRTEPASSTPTPLNTAANISHNAGAALLCVEAMRYVEIAGV